MGQQIFLSYRRTVSSDLAKELEKRLKEKFGEHSVFFDLESIAPGEDFWKKIRSALKDSPVGIALIGPGWTDELKKRFKKYGKSIDDVEEIKRVVALLDDGATPAYGKEDYHLLELVALIARKQRVIPVFHGRQGPLHFSIGKFLARFSWRRIDEPNEVDIPPTIMDLLWADRIDLRESDDGVSRLIDALRHMGLKGPNEPPPPPPEIPFDVMPSQTDILNDVVDELRRGFAARTDEHAQSASHNQSLIQSNDEIDHFQELKPRPILIISPNGSGASELLRHIAHKMDEFGMLRYWCEARDVVDADDLWRALFRVLNPKSVELNSAERVGIASLTRDELAHRNKPHLLLIDNLSQEGFRQGQNLGVWDAFRNFPQFRLVVAVRGEIGQTPVGWIPCKLERAKATDLEWIFKQTFAKPERKEWLSKLKRIGWSSLSTRVTAAAAFRIGRAGAWPRPEPADTQELLDRLLIPHRFCEELPTATIAKSLSPLRDDDAVFLLAILAAFPRGLLETDLIELFPDDETVSGDFYMMRFKLNTRSLVVSQPPPADLPGHTPSDILILLPEIRAAVLKWLSQERLKDSRFAKKLDDSLQAVMQHFLNRAEAKLASPTLWSSGSLDAEWLTFYFPCIEIAIEHELQVANDSARQLLAIKITRQLSEMFRVLNLGSEHLLSKAAEAALRIVDLHNGNEAEATEAAAGCYRGAAWLYAWSDDWGKAESYCISASKLYNANDNKISWHERNHGLLQMERTRAIIFRSKGAPNEAEVPLNEAIKKIDKSDPKLAPLYWNIRMDLGDVLYSQMKYWSAAEQWQEILSGIATLPIDASNFPYLESGMAKKRLGDVRLKEGDCDAARKLFEEAIKDHSRAGSIRGRSVSQLRLFECDMIQKGNSKIHDKLTELGRDFERTRAWGAQNYQQMLCGYCRIQDDNCLDEVFELFQTAAFRAKERKNRFAEIMYLHGMCLSAGSNSMIEARDQCDKVLSSRSESVSECYQRGFEFLGMLQLTPIRFEREREELWGNAEREWHRIEDSRLHDVLERHRPAN